MMRVKPLRICELADEIPRHDERSYPPGDSPANRVMHSILHEALLAGASEIHLHPQDDTGSVQITVDGARCELVSLPKSLHWKLVCRYLWKAGILRTPQVAPGEFRVYHDHLPFRIGVRAIPAAGSYAVAMDITGE